MWGGVQRPIAGRNQSTTMPGGQPSAMPTSRRTTSFYPTIRPGNGSARTIFGGPSSPRGSCSPAARRSRGTRGERPSQRHRHPDHQQDQDGEDGDGPQARRPRGRAVHVERRLGRRDEARHRYCRYCISSRTGNALGPSRLPPILNHQSCKKHREPGRVSRSARIVLAVGSPRAGQSSPSDGR